MFFNITGTYTDQYQLTMGQAYFLKGQKDDKAIFDYFFRKLPFDGGYAVFAGLGDLLEQIEQFRFDAEDISYLKSQGFNSDYLNYLKNFHFTGNIYSSKEGEIVFPTSPVLTVEANIIEAQLIETMLLNILNFQTLIATKASRMRFVAGKRKLIEFGLRRAQGAGGYFASKASVIGGFDSTSHVRVGRDYDIPISGTMAHSFVQSYDDEISAFRDFSEVWSDNCVLLVDTYNTLEQGVPNAIKIGKEMEKRGNKLKGIRLDSGDLAYLAKKSRQLLDEAGLDYVEIAASNQLDEHVIKSLLEQKAPIDIFGVGTNLAIGAPDAALDGVYKLAFARGKPRIKLSESLNKITLPGKKQVYRFFNGNGDFLGADIVALAEESNHFSKMFHPFESAKSMSVKGYEMEPLLHKVMENGKPTMHTKTLKETMNYHQKRLKLLPSEYKRFENPHIYKIGLSLELMNKREDLRKKHEQE